MRSATSFSPEVFERHDLEKRVEELAPETEFFGEGLNLEEFYDLLLSKAEDLAEN